MKNKQISIRYAKPLLQVAIAKGILDKVHRNMAFITSVCAKEPLVKKIFSNPTLATKKKRDILDKLLGKDINKFKKP